MIMANIEHDSLRIYIYLRVQHYYHFFMNVILAKIINLELESVSYGFNAILSIPLLLEQEYIHNLEQI